MVNSVGSFTEKTREGVGVKGKGMGILQLLSFEILSERIVAVFTFLWMLGAVF